MPCSPSSIPLSYAYFPQEPCAYVYWVNLGQRKWVTLSNILGGKSWPVKGCLLSTPPEDGRGQAVYCFWEVPESSIGMWVSHLSWLYQRQLPGWRTNPFLHHPSIPPPRGLLSTKVTLPWPSKAQVMNKSLPHQTVPLPFEVIYEAAQALCLSQL